MKISIGDWKLKEVKEFMYHSELINNRDDVGKQPCNIKSKRPLFAHSEM